jgi:hypothetical protein
MKKFIALLTALGLLLSFAACGKSDQNTEPATNVTQMNDDEINQLENELFGTTVPPTEATTAPGETVTEENSSTEEATTVTSDETTTAAPSNALSDNPAEWSKEQIVKYYKLAAAKSSNVTSKKTMVMKELVVNEGNGFWN